MSFLTYWPWHGRKEFQMKIWRWMRQTAASHGNVISNLAPGTGGGYIWHLSWATSCQKLGCKASNIHFSSRVYVKKELLWLYVLWISNAALNRSQLDNYTFLEMFKDTSGKPQSPAVRMAQRLASLAIIWWTLVPLPLMGLWNQAHTHQSMVNFFPSRQRWKSGWSKNWRDDPPGKPSFLGGSSFGILCSSDSFAYLSVSREQFLAIVVC